MELEQFAAASAVLIGLVNGVRLVQDKNYWGFGYFCLAVGAGGLLGHWQWFGLPDAQMGLLLGIGSSGVYRVGQVVSGK